MSHMWDGQYKVLAIHPDTEKLEEAILKEDWFGPRKDAIRIAGFNTPHFLADNIIYEFSD